MVEIAPRKTRRLAPLLSWAALGVSVIFLAVFFFQAGEFANFEAPEPPAELPQDAKQNIAVVKSEITGFDREGQPFLVDAQRALQNPDQPNIINLHVVSGRLNKPSGAVISVAADAGRYDSDSKKLELNGNVQISDSQRYRAQMPQAEVLLDKKSLFTTQPVVVTFAGGQILSNGLAISDNARHIRFFNRVHLRYGGKNSKGDKGE